MKNLSSSIIKFLIDNKKTIATAESLTGGLLSAKLVDTSGASNAFKGGITAYMLEIKDKILDIPIEHTHKTDGVDMLTSQLMAKNVSLLLDTDYALSTTGIAETWDERPLQAFITLYDRKNDKFHTLHEIFESDNELEKNITREIVRNRTVNISLKLFNDTYIQNIKS